MTRLENLDKWALMLSGVPGYQTEPTYSLTGILKWFSTLSDSRVMKGYSKFDNVVEIDFVNDDIKGNIENLFKTKDQ